MELYSRRKTQGKNILVCIPNSPVCIHTYNPGCCPDVRNESCQYNQMIISNLRTDV